MAASIARGRPLAHLHTGVDRVLEDAGMSLDDLEQVAVVTGPGSWIGIQIAVTTAKTLAQVTGLPLIPISRLEAMAWGYASHLGIIAVLIDANNENLYTCTFASRPDAPPEPIEEPAKRTVAASESLIAALGEQVLLVGDGAVRYANRLVWSSPVHGRVAVAQLQTVQPEALAQLAYARRTDVLRSRDMMTLEPLYLLGTDELREYKRPCLS